MPIKVALMRSYAHICNTPTTHTGGRKRNSRYTASRRINLKFTLVGATHSAHSKLTAANAMRSHSSGSLGPYSGGGFEPMRPGLVSVVPPGRYSLCIVCARSRGWATKGLRASCVREFWPTRIERRLRGAVLQKGEHNSFATPQQLDRLISIQPNINWVKRPEGTVNLASKNSEQIYILVLYALLARTECGSTNGIGKYK